MKTIIKDWNYETWLGFLWTDWEIYSWQINSSWELLCSINNNSVVWLTWLNNIKDWNYETCLFWVDSTDSTNLIPLQVSSDWRLLVEVNWI